MVDYEYNPYENVGYMVMELGSASLRQYLQGAPLNDQSRRMFWQQIVGILGALEDAHIGNSIKNNYTAYILILNLFFKFQVHADIKPDNMIIVDNVLKITDLGLAFGLASSKQFIQRPVIRGTIGISFLILYLFDLFCFRLYGT